MAVYGIPTITFATDGLLAFLLFHGLVWASIPVIGGVCLALHRRLSDGGAAATQTFAYDFVPLLLLLTISISGVLLTVSYTWLDGGGHEMIAVLHAASVILTLLWLPFGKLLHVPQRYLKVAQIAYAYEAVHGDKAERATCAHCDEPFASARQVEDLIIVQQQLGYRYQLKHEQHGTDHYQHICPRCRRHLLVTAQGVRMRPITSPFSEQEKESSEGVEEPRPSYAALTPACPYSTCPNQASRKHSTSPFLLFKIPPMAIQPVPDHEIIRQFGPSLSHRVEAPVETGDEKLVKTHCCFCGQQCGIQLKVRDNSVVGFEPWYDFPFNQGKLCPKGVKRYLQGGHPDRIDRALLRDPSAPGGFRPTDYQQAIDRVAAEIKRLQDLHGPQAVGILSGASLTTEKAYLMGKFARVGLKTPYIDYNGRLCMVSAAGANKLAFGIDRAANPWSDIVGTDVVWIAGANIAECAPITTDYVWQAREHGAKIIVTDPRLTPIARTCDLFLPVKPGRDIALFNGVLKILIDWDMVDRDFIDANTTGFAALAEHVEQWDS
ncbi:MAG: molybdopterin oxidoreductase family protein, partial [Planctomycetota bacterium]